MPSARTRIAIAICSDYMKLGARVSDGRSPGRCVTVDLQRPPATSEDPMTEDRMALVELLQPFAALHHGLLPWNAGVD